MTRDGSGKEVHLSRHGEVVQEFSALGGMSRTFLSVKTRGREDFPGGPVAKTLPMQGAWVQSLAPGTSSHVPQLKRSYVPQLRPGMDK